MAHRSFGAAKAEATGEPITFDVAGEPFEVPMPFPAIALLDLTEQALNMENAGLSDDDPEAVKATFSAFSGFLAEALGDDYPRFKAAARRARLDLPELLEVVQYVVSEVSGRPFTQPSSSPPQPSPASTPSTVTSSDPAAVPSFS